MTPDCDSNLEIDDTKLELNEKYDMMLKLIIYKHIFKLIFRMDNNYNNINSFVLVDILDELICVKDLQSNGLKWIIFDQIKIGPYKKLEEYYDQILDVFK